MAEKTEISWTDATFNPWIGCTKVSPGCEACYAEAMMDKRYGRVKWGPGEQRIRTSEANWRLPLQWSRKAERQRRRVRVFCASLADVFDNEVPAAWRVDLFRLIAKTTMHLDWLLLTKRIGNAKRMLNEVVDELSCGINTWDELPWPGVWIGATVVDQAEAHRDIPKLLAVPARVRFLSIEPMLGPIDLVQASTFRSDGKSIINQFEARASLGDGPTIDWVIVGGESGPLARPMHPDWTRSLRINVPHSAFHFTSSSGAHGLQQSQYPMTTSVCCRRFWQTGSAYPLTRAPWISSVATRCCIEREKWPPAAYSTA